MIKVAYNYQTFTHQKYGGISRVFSNIASIISLSDEFDVTVHAGLYQNKYLSSNVPDLLVRGRQLSYPAYPPKSERFFLAINPLLCKFTLAAENPDIVHETYYSDLDVAPKKSRTVITVMDMIHEKFSASMGISKFQKTKANSIRRADSIICVSEHTKQDLVEILNIDPEKVSVVYVGHSLQKSVEVDDCLPLVSSPYLLYVGFRGRLYKNFNRLLEAYSVSKNLKENFKLVCFGSNTFSRKELDIIESHGIDRSDVLYFSGNDSILSNLYTHAAAFIYPSLYEGFGMPPLEAMSFSCPVVCSNVSSIPEVAGDAAQYFDPYDVDDMSRAIEEVVFSPSLRQAMIARGKSRVKLFSWEKCAQETMSVYKKVLGDF